jgi:hypothetical protein
LGEKGLRRNVLVRKAEDKSKRRRNVLTGEKDEEENPRKQEMLRTNVLSKSTAVIATSSSKRDHYWLQGVRSGPRESFFRFRGCSL